MFVNPFMMWNRLAWKVSEMALGSAQVIALRTNGPRPGGKELLMMSREKGEAAVASMQSMALPFFRMNQQLATLAFNQMLSAWSSMLSIASSRTPAQSLERQLKLAGTTISNSAVAAAKIADSGARVARSGLKPVHKRVKANVVRLRKKSR